MKKYTITFLISLVWLICENTIREILLVKNTQVLFVTDTKPVALYSFIGLLCVFVLEIICNVKIDTPKFIVISVMCFVFPLAFLQVRTEVYQDKIVFYDATAQAEEYYVEDIESVSCKLDYKGKEEIPYNGVRFIYEIHLCDKKVELYGTHKEAFWKNILILDKEINKCNIKKSFSGVEYIETVNHFNKIDQLCNFMFGVYSNINIIEEIMSQSVSGAMCSDES